MLQYSSRIVETDTVSPEFSRNVLTFTLCIFVLTQMCRSPSPMLSYVFWLTQTTVIPKSILGKGNRIQVFQNFQHAL